MRTFILAMAIYVGASSTFAADKMQPVTGFDLNRYLGTWYEIARMDVPYEWGLTHVTAVYSLQPDGKVRVQNEGTKANGKREKAIGKAKFASSDRTVGHLKVSFFLFFYGDYTIVQLDKQNYSYALVVSSKDAMWILSRKPQLDAGIVTQLKGKADELGIDTTKLYMTPQN